MSSLKKGFGSVNTLLVGTLLLLGSCSQENVPPEQGTLARVGNSILTYEEAVEGIPSFMLEEDSLSAVLRYRDNWIRRQVILQEAMRLDVRSNPDVIDRIERLEEEVLIQGLRDYILAMYDENLVVTDEEAQNYYQANRDQLVLNERYVRFRHLTASTMEEARAARQDLLRGIEWPEVARQYSINPEVQISESEKFWPISMAFADNNEINGLLRRFGVEEISNLYRINGNYHFVQLMETRDEGDHPDLDWLMEHIKDWLLLEKRRRHFNSYVTNLYLNAQSNNELETFNVVTSNSNTESIESDTLVSSQSDE